MTRSSAGSASGDYLFIQFGHNDQKPDERYTDPATTYRSYLARYVETARRHGVQPVLLSSVERRKFNEAGTLLFTHGDYPAAMEQLADELGVPFIDLRRRTRELYEGVGPVESRQWFVWLRPGEHPNYPAGSEDDTHFNVAGAREVARLAAQELLASALPIKSFITMPQ